MSRWWVALAEEAPDDAAGWAALSTLDGASAGGLAAWESDGRPQPGAVTIDPRAIDLGGEEAEISLALAPADVDLPYDDPSVAEARRAVLRAPWPALMTTLARDATHLGGAITLVRGPDRRPLDDDPFARLLPARRLVLGPGLLGTLPPPAGPVLERYGGQPWPYDRFPD